MTPHRMVIEAGPGTVRRLCCGAARSAKVNDASVEAALDCIDDPVALVGGRPVAVAALWADLLRSLACPERGPDSNSVLIIHPSWWPISRIDVVAGAARTLTGHPDRVATGSRASLLAGAPQATEATVVVEIAARLVAVTAVGAVAESIAEPRLGSPDQVAEAVRRRVAELTDGAGNAILIDGPPDVGGAGELATMIAKRVRAALPGAAVELVDGTRLTAAAARPPTPPPEPVPRDRRAPRAGILAAALILLVVLSAGLTGRVRPDAPPAAPGAEAAADVLGPEPTFLVEGRVVIQVPAGWPVRRVTGGPGSARVEVTSPIDPQVVLHLTQSLAPGETLEATAESLRLAMDRANAAGPPGVFVGLDPSGTSAGRPAVTYRELRDDHQIDWAVLVDGAVRISIGCQGRADGDDPAGTARAACEQAVRSARALYRPG